MAQTVKPDTFDPAALFTQLLAEAQAEMVNPPKSKTGQKGYQTYSYSPLDLVLNIIRPPLNKRGIFFYQRSEVAANGAGMLLNTVVAYGDEERVLDVKPYEYASDPQEFGKRETYARRYSALMAFGLVGEGRLRQSKWEKDGQKHSRLEVIADNVTFSGGAKRDDVPDEVYDDDCPF